jgi:murein DD-endopeptidase MepM/ murein hydrolase activator NlpD
MRTPRRSFPRALWAALLISLGGFALVASPAHLNVARAATAAQLRQQISAGTGKASSLSGTVTATSSRLRAVSSRVGSLEKQIAAVQADLDLRRAELLKLRRELSAAHARLIALEASQAHAETVLARQLVNGYESDPPDIVTVVLEARGFQDLLEQLAFAQRIRKQDVQVTSEVRAARGAVAAQATKLGSLEQRAQTLAEAVLSEGQKLVQTQAGLVQQQRSLAALQSEQADQLAGERAGIAALQRQLSQVLAAQAAAAARARRLAASTPSNPPGSPERAPQTSSSGGFTFPMPKADASPPGTWTLDQGVDISAPGGTPEVAVCSGTIVLHGIGGFGPWAPVLHCDSPLSGGGYVYYGHAGPSNQLPVGTHVSAGQVISEVGPGIVGISSGPHVEIGFCDSSGTPIGGGTASAMMTLLQAAYGA